MENDLFLEALNSHKNKADSTASGHPEDHDASDNNIDTAPEEENETNTVENNQDEDSKGVFFSSNFRSK